MIEPTDLDWLALCLVTESNRPEEWSAIAQVIENRRRSGRWGPSFREVILSRRQFSAFNPITDILASMTYTEAWRDVAHGEDRLLLVRAAGFCATTVEQAWAAGETIVVWEPSISEGTLHYWSPVSMKTPGSKPPWAAHAKRLYTPPGIDPERFIFAEAVP